MGGFSFGAATSGLVAATAWAGKIRSSSLNTPAYSEYSGILYSLLCVVVFWPDFAHGAKVVVGGFSFGAATAGLVAANARPAHFHRPFEADEENLLYIEETLCTPVFPLVG